MTAANAEAHKQRQKQRQHDRATVEERSPRATERVAARMRPKRVSPDAYLQAVTILTGGGIQKGHGAGRAVTETTTTLVASV